MAVQVVYQWPPVSYTIAMTATSTTIKLTATTRDRVKDIGSRTGETAEQVVAHALDEYERALFFQDYRTAVESEGEPSADEQAEQRLWNRAALQSMTGE